MLDAEIHIATPRRSNYIFQKGFALGNSEVVFNPNVSPAKPLESIASDHTDVLVQILLQQNSDGQGWANAINTI